MPTKKKVAPTGFLADPLQLAAQFDVADKARATLLGWIDKTLKPGVDWFTIHRDTCPQRGTGTTKERACAACGSKATLGKPGAEKIATACGLIAKFTRDLDTWEMLGSVAGLVTYVCTFTDMAGHVVGEGRGAKLMTEGDPNVAVKMAEKAAYLDGVIRACGLSEVFTQDLDDMTRAAPKPARAPETPPTAPTATPVAPEAPAAVSGAPDAQEGDSRRVPRPEEPPPPPPEPITAETMATLRRMAVPAGGYPDWERRRERIKEHLAKLRVTRLDDLHEMVAQGIILDLEGSDPQQTPAGGNGATQKKPTVPTMAQVRGELARVCEVLGLSPQDVPLFETYIARAAGAPNLDTLGPAEAMRAVDASRQLGNVDLPALRLAMDRAGRVAQGEP